MLFVLRFSNGAHILPHPLKESAGRGVLYLTGGTGTVSLLVPDLVFFDPRTPTHNPPLSVTIHQGAAILADGSGEDKTIPNIIFRSQKIGGSDVKAFN